jgi:hypothetical protein
MTEEALGILCRNIDRLQNALGQRILLENPSSYVRFRHSSIPEWEFLSAAAQQTGCGILCDVNNIYVSARNHGWDASHYLAALPSEAIGEIHLAGHAVKTLGDGTELRIDDHGAPVTADVWALYAQALRRFGPVPTLIEWDTNIPALEILLAEAGKAADLLERAGAEASHAVAA